MKYQPKILERTQFGNSILQTKARTLSLSDIKTDNIQQLIEDMLFTLSSKNYGVGIAAPQVNVGVALSVIDIHPSDKNRDIDQPFRQVIINPKIVSGKGKKTSMWEGCLSFGSKNSPVFAQTMRYKSVRVEFYDENAKKYATILEDLPAQVFQHEVDHLNGVLFPERVVDHTTWMNAKEYRKMKRNKR